MKVKVNDPGSVSAKRRRLDKYISELVYDTYNTQQGALPYTEGDVLWINPVSFEIGICQRDDMPQGCHYHPIEEVAMEWDGLVTIRPEYVEQIVNHYFPE